MGFTLVNLIATSIAVAANNFRYGKNVIYICASIYSTFFLSAVGVQIWYIAGNVETGN